MFEIKYDRHGQPIKDLTQPMMQDSPMEIQEQPKIEPIEQLQAAPEVEENLQQETQEIKQEPIKEVQQEASQAKNFRQIREQKERAERERDELFRRIQEMEAGKQAQPIVQEDDNLNINPDDLVEGKHLNKYDKKIKQLQNELKTYQQQTQLTATEVRLKNQFPDFDKIVSRDNIEQLRMDYPELAETLNASNDIYAKAVSAYTLIKKLGISPTEDVYQEDKEKAIKNAVKPKPLVSVSPQQGDTPLSRANAFANGLTDELKTQLRREMEEARKNR